MSGPGKGRYTNYVPVGGDSASAYARRYSLFNAKSSGDKGAFFGISDGWKKYVQDAAKYLEAGEGDTQLFPVPVKMDFGDAPNLADVSLSRSGDPGNQYVPDISSPGASDSGVNVDPRSKTGNGGISIETVKPDYVVPTGIVSQDAATLGGQSPSNTSVSIGASPVGADFVKGKSKGTDGG